LVTVYLKNELYLPRIIKRLYDKYWALNKVNQMLCHQAIVRILWICLYTTYIWKRDMSIHKFNGRFYARFINVGMCFSRIIVDEKP
jgi:hypothetical protein